MSVTVCPRKFGPFTVCGTALETTTVDGRLVECCPACARFQAGVCHDCPRPVAGARGRARRCAVHKAAEMLAKRERYRDRHRSEINRRARTYMRLPDVRQRSTANQRLWRKANPDKVKAQGIRRVIRQVHAERARRAA